MTTPTYQLSTAEEFILVYQQNSPVRRQVYGWVKQEKRRVRVLIYDPTLPGRHVGRFLVVHWCEAHSVGWEIYCPLCRNEPRERMRRILESSRK